MNKLITAVILVATCSYFSSPIETAEAGHLHHHPSETHTQPTASWYGARFNGKRTASGERFNMYAMTAAHKSLRLNTYAEVRNLKNNRSVIVRINDRYPFHSRSVMALSYAAAKELGMRDTTEIQITPLDSNHALAVLK